jgi:hypothetical protein
MRLLVLLVLVVVAGPCHAQSAEEVSQNSKLEDAAAKVKKRDDAAAERQRKLADEKLARTEARWKEIMGSICTGCGQPARR